MRTVRPARGRRLGQFFRSGDWSDYWQTAISYVGKEKLLIRGYSIEEVIDRLSYAETLWLTLRGELPTRAQARVLDAALCSIPDHQFIASHTPSARFVASAFPESPVPGIAAGILTAGSNTVSPQETGKLIALGLSLMKERGLTREQAAEAVVEQFQAEGRLIPGLGHPTHKEHDPRATALEKVARENGVWGEGPELYKAVHAAFVRRTGKSLPINIDGMLACVLTELGFNDLQMVGVALAAILPGIIAHVVEEITEGVPLRVIPEEHGSVYTGPDERHIPADRA